jgi:hypothetical protein
MGRQPSETAAIGAADSRYRETQHRVTLQAPAHDPDGFTVNVDRTDEHHELGVVSAGRRERTSERDER